MTDVAVRPDLLKLCGITQETRYLEKVVDFQWNVADDLGGVALVDLRDLALMSTNKQKKGSLWVLSFGPRSKANNPLVMYYKTQANVETVRTFLSAEKKRQVQHDEAMYANLDIPVKPVVAVSAATPEPKAPQRGTWRNLVRRFVNRVREQSHG